jgi:hypothetical protein
MRILRISLSLFGVELKARREMRREVRREEKNENC